MPIIYTNASKSKFFYCDEHEQKIITIETKPNGALMSTITGKDVPKLMLELKHDAKYNFDYEAPIQCSHADFAEAFLKVQRQLTNAMNPVNQSLYHNA